MMQLRSALASARDLANRWPTRMAISPETGLPVCIQTVRLTYEAFRLAGFLDVEPMSCELVALNSAARRQIEEQRAVKGSCRIEIGPDAPDNDRLPTGWRGHLILQHPHFLLDLTFAGVIQALKAPGFGSVGAFCAEKNEEAQLVDGTWTSVTDTGVVIMYRPRPDDETWRTQTAWTDWGDLDREAAAKLAFIIDKKASAHESP